MSDDLISRSTLMQSLRGNVLVDVTPNLEQAIAEQPVAYDVDKAGERLKVAFERTVAEILDRTDSEVTIADFNIGKYTESLEEIVRTGGIE